MTPRRLRSVPASRISRKAGSSRRYFGQARVRAVDAPYVSSCFRVCWAKGKIRFESGRATIDPDSAGLLDRLIETALRLPSANIEIAGHTDADGEDVSTRRFRKARAGGHGFPGESGLPAERFTGDGATAGTPARSPAMIRRRQARQNRRIDFVVR